MGRRGARRAGSTDEDPVAIALEHEIRRWEAEVATERQLLQRENGLLAVAAAILGLGMFRLEALETASPAWWMWVVRALALTGLVLLILALSRLIMTIEDTLARRSLRASAPAPTTRLGGPESRGSGWEMVSTARRARLRALDLTRLAATALHLSNLQRGHGIEVGQRYLLVSALFGALAVIALVLGRACLA